MKTDENVSVSTPAGTLRPYLQLLKPRVSSLVVVTTAAGFYLASGTPVDSWGLVCTVLATALLAGGSVCLNQVLERNEDARMHRTAGRPLPAGRVSVLSATVYGLSLIVAGTLVLAFMLSLSPAILGLTSSLIYLLAYTPLKRQTPLCTTVGALPGAIPPLIGWTAAGGELTVKAWILFGILFLWQYPHFLAIAWIHREDYRRAGFKMLPLVDASGRRTAGQIVLFTLLLACFSILPWNLELAGNVYLGVAVGLSLGFLAATLSLLITPTQAYAGYVMRASVLYLPFLLGVLVVDRV